MLCFALIFIGMHKIVGYPCTIIKKTCLPLHSMPSVAGIFNKDSGIVDKGPDQFIECVALMF